MRNLVLHILLNIFWHYIASKINGKFSYEFEDTKLKDETFLPVAGSVPQTNVPAHGSSNQYGKRWVASNCNNAGLSARVLFKSVNISF